MSVLNVQAHKNRTVGVLITCLVKWKSVCTQKHLISSGCSGQRKEEICWMVPGLLCQAARVKKRGRFCSSRLRTGCCHRCGHSEVSWCFHHASALPCPCFVHFVSCLQSATKSPQLSSDCRWLWQLSSFWRWGALCGPLPLHWTVWRRTVLWGNMRDQLYLLDLVTNIGRTISRRIFFKNTWKDDEMQVPLNVKIILWILISHLKETSVLQEGATILVIGKDEEAWWKGECNGKTGVFPSNYVEAAKCKYLPMQCAHKSGLEYLDLLWLVSRPKKNHTITLQYLIWIGNKTLPCMSKKNELPVPV